MTRGALDRHRPVQRGVPALDSASVVAPTERRIPGWILATAHKLVRVIHAGLHDRPYTDPGIDDERLVVERHAPRWGRRVPVRRCDRESRIPGSSRMIPAYPGLKLGLCLAERVLFRFARDCPLRHPVLPMLALRDRSRVAPRFPRWIQAISAVTGAAPGR